MALALAHVQMSTVQILKSSFEVLDVDASPAGDDRLAVNFSTAELEDKGNGTSRLEALLTVNSAPQEGIEQRFSLEVTARAAFVGHNPDGECPLEDFERYMRVNAYSLLYGFVRSHIQQLSCMTPLKQVSLPCIDMGSIEAQLAEPPLEEAEGQSS